jgi:hypothetical protein
MFYVFGVIYMLGFIATVITAIRLMQVDRNNLYICIAVYAVFVYPLTMIVVQFID